MFCIYRFRPPRLDTSAVFLRLINPRRPVKPIDELVAAMVACLTDDLHELFQERAAIREYDGGLSRELAEAMALLDVIHLYPKQACACGQ